MPANIKLKEMCGFFFFFIEIKKKNYMNIFPSQDETHPFSHSNSQEARSVHVSVCTRNDVVM